MNQSAAYAIQFPDGSVTPLAFPSEDALLYYMSLGYGVSSEAVRKRLEQLEYRIVEVKLFTIS